MSKQIDIPLSLRPNYNTDAIANAIASDDMFNVYLEPVEGVGPTGKGFITRRRPGLKLEGDSLTNAPGDGIFYWDATQKVIAVSGGKIFEFHEDGTFTELTFTPSSYSGASTAGYLSAENSTSLISLFLTSQPTDRVAHKLTLTSTDNLSGSSFVVTGIDKNSKDQTETFAAGPNNNTVTGSLYFAKVKTLAPSIATPNNLTGLVTGATGAGPFATFANQPPSGFACKFYASSLVDLSAISLTITGTDIYDNVQTETIAVGPNLSAPVQSTLFYKTFSIITISSTYGANVANFGWTGGTSSGTDFTYGGTFDFGWAAAHLQPSSNGLTPAIPVTFADGQQVDGTPWLYMAAQGLVYVLNDMRLYNSADTNTPDATHVGWINSRFVANEYGTNRFDFTDVNPATGEFENDYWGSTDNPLQAQARGDLLSTLFTAFQDIYVWGTEGAEVWQDDGVTPFSPIQGAFAEAGIEGPYAYGRVDNTIFALCVIESKRVIVRMNGRTPLVVSEPIARILSEMSVVSDAFCDIIAVGGIAVALFTFPTANQTWAYDYKNDTWCRWSYYNTTNGNHERFLGQHSCFAKAWNKHLIMSRIDGKIYSLDRNLFADDDTVMVTYRRTGWIDRGTLKRKRIGQLYIKVKVYPKGGTTSVMQLRWRDDGRPQWSVPMDISLNPDVQGNFVVPINRMGTNRARQYEFRLTDNVDMVLVGATEDVEVLKN